MLKFSPILIGLIMLFATGNADASPKPSIAAESAILVDAVTGEILYEKNARVRRPTASTTKIMTGILALEHGDLDSVVTVSDNASKTPFSSLNLKRGETMTLEDLLYAVLLRSANDGSVAAAEHIAGTEAEFLDMMNRKAKEIGANDTNFMNPHGLHHQNHYSTAYDQALIARYAIKNPDFNRIVGTRTKVIERSMNDKDLRVRSTVRLLGNYEGADGIKTGYTRHAGRCLVGSATQNDWRLIAVVLKSPDPTAETQKLLDYGFNNYAQVAFTRINEPAAQIPVRWGVEETLELLADDDLAMIVPKTAAIENKVDIKAKRVTAPIVEGQHIGTLTGYVNEEEIGTVNLLAANSIDRTLAATIWIVVRALLLAIAALIIGFIIYGTAVAKIARRRRRSLQA